MRKSSIHIEKGNLGYCFHNTRQKPTANSIFSQEKNEYDNDAVKAIELYKNELRKRETAYTKRTGKKLHKNTITHLSAIVNLNQTHTLEDLKKVADYLEESLDAKVFQVALHADEGYIDKETGEKHINNHGHIEMLALDSKGNSIRRKLTRSYLIQLQNKVAEILNMQRGINYTKEQKKRPKRLGTYEYKEYAKRKARELKPLLQENKQLQKENEEIKLSKKELEKQISELRKKMIAYNKEKEEKEKEFTQEDYNYLSALKKELKANNLKEIYQKIIEFKEDFENRINNKNQENKQLKARILDIEYKNKKLEKENTELKTELQTKIDENTELKQKITELENRLIAIQKKAVRIIKKLWQKLTQLRKKREERQHQQEQQVDIDTLINYLMPELKNNTQVYYDFVDEVTKNEPNDIKNKAELIEWLDNAYSDENFKEWLHSNYTAEEIQNIAYQLNINTRQINISPTGTGIKR